MLELDPVPRGPLALSAEARSWLARLAARYGRSGPLSIDPEPVEDAERVLGSVIPDEVIALLAVEGRMPGDLVRWTRAVGAFYEATEAGLARRLGFDHVAFGFLVGEPDAWGAAPHFAVFERRTSRALPADLRRWVMRKVEPGGDPCSLADYCALKGATREAAPAIEIVIASPTVVDRFVTHAKFGRGRELSRAEGKVTVEFADGTVRTLAAAFVTPEP